MRAIGLTIKILIIDCGHLEYVFDVDIQKQDKGSTDFCSILTGYSRTLDRELS